MNYQRGVMSSVLGPSTRPIMSSALSSMNNRHTAPDTWTPNELFASGEQGVWYDPSDLSTLFQDSAGTIPVTSSNQPVGRMLDKSGNGRHATQPTSTSRPVYMSVGDLSYLSFDGIDDYMVIDGATLLSGVSGVTTLCAYEAVDSTTFNPFVYFSTAVTANQVRYIAALGPTANKVLRLQARRLDEVGNMTRDSAPVTNGKSVSSFTMNYSEALASIRHNGALITEDTLLTPGVTSSTNSLASYLGWINETARNMCPMYGLIIRVPHISDPDLMTRAENYLSSKIGI